MRIRRLGWPGWPIAARAAGCAATVLIAVAGCTAITDGAPTADLAIAPAYRTSVSASISASSQTSRIQESKRAVKSACESFIEGAKPASEKLESYIDTVNSGANAAAAESEARDALNHGADLVAGSVGETLPPDLRESLNAYVDAARAVATGMSPDPSPDVLNGVLRQFRDSIAKSKRSCLAYLK